MAERIMLLKTGDNVGMGGASCVELYCTLLKNGGLSIRTCINQYEYGRYWQSSFRRIRTPKQLLIALNTIEGISEHYTEYEVLEQLFMKLPYLAIHTAIYERYRDDGHKDHLFGLAYPLVKNIEIGIPRSFSKAVSLFDVIYNYVLVWVNQHNCLPTGEHKILDSYICFPSEKRKQVTPQD